MGFGGRKLDQGQKWSSVLIADFYDFILPHYLMHITVDLETLIFLSCTLSLAVAFDHTVKSLFTLGSNLASLHCASFAP